MSLQNLETIDMVVKSLEDIPNGIELYIVDNGGINDEIERYKLLTRKLATYLNFVVSEAFVDENPNTKISDIVIRVLCQRPPNEAMLEVKAVMPKNDRDNRVQVIYENLEEFLSGKFTSVKQKL